MYKNTKDENGFASFEILLIVVVLILVGLAGWSVYKNRTINSNGANSQEAESPSAVVEDKAISDAPINTANDKFITTDENKVFYQAPEGWKIEPEPVTEIINGNYRYKSGSITLTSPDYVISDEYCAEPESGAKMRIYIFNPGNTAEIEETNEDYINSIIENTTGFIKNSVRTQMANQPAVQYLSTPGECGYTVHTSTIINKFEVSVSTSADDIAIDAPYLKEPYSSIYNALVSSIKIE